MQTKPLTAPCTATMPRTSAKATASLSDTTFWMGAGGVFVLALAAFGLAAQWQKLEAFSSFDIGTAVLLGLFARQPAWRGWQHYGAAWLANALILSGYSNHDIAASCWMALSDAAGLWVGVRLLERLPPAVLQMRREQSPWSVLLACLAASTVSTAVSLPATLGSLSAPLPSEVLVVLATEFMNQLLVVPLILSFTTQRRPYRGFLAESIPFLILIASEILASLIGGPGAIAFTLPALIWCALRYHLFPTAILFVALTLWKCAAFTTGAGSTGMAVTYFSDLLSLRLGLSLLWLGPLTVACSHAARNEVLEQLNHASQHDYLTQTLVRATFLRRSDHQLAQLRKSASPMAVMMLDIDYFKQVNDQHGHGMGDTVLQGFALTLSRQLRDSDVIGRYGGEEFCACLPGVDLENAQRVAERLRKAVLTQVFTTPKGHSFHITVSVGLVHFAAAALPESVEAALAQADALLYRAKSGGRNRVETLSLTTPQVTPPGADESTAMPVLQRMAAVPLKG